MNNNRIDLSFDNINHEKAMWKAVILQAFIDLQSNSQKKSAKNNKTKAILWFNLNNSDFRTVCQFAELDPYYVWSKAEIIKRKIFDERMVS